MFSQEKKKKKEEKEKKRTLKVFLGQGDLTRGTKELEEILENRNGKGVARETV
jgi:hypothetical protein